MAKIRPEQFGLRNQHSTITQISNVLYNITNKDNPRYKTVAISLDIEKAFNRVCQSELIVKFLAMETLSQLIKIVHSFPTNRKFFIKLENKTLSIRKIKAGVPQGCLSPRLFSVFINEMPISNIQKLPGLRTTRYSTHQDA